MTATQNHVDPHLHLFLDDAEIHQLYGLRRVVNRPARRSDPVLAPTMPWEQGCRTQAWGSVVAEPDGLLRMWVRLHARGMRAGEEEILACVREILAAAAPPPAMEPVAASRHQGLMEID